MSHFQLTSYTILLIILVLLSAFFSAAETGLMAINRYRLRHKARLKKRSAVLILKLLKRPDQVLGMILIGNTCANIFASALATLLAVQLFGEKAVFISTALLTLFILIFSEVTPKTLAALYPDRVASTVAWPIYGLLLLFYPIVWLLNIISNNLLRIFGIRFKENITEPLTREELYSVVYETSGRLSNQYQNMLIGILDLNKLTVRDAMTPQHQIMGIDLDADWKLISKQLASSEYDWLPVYRENINHVVGILHLRDLIHEVLSGEVINQDKLLSILHEPYFIPEITALSAQLNNFQQEQKRLALVVDEYGEILGLVTIEDILEEIVGEFTTTLANEEKRIESQADGSFIVDGSTTLRELNRITGCQLPTTGPRTLNGLIIEYLEVIPQSSVCLRIADYPIEILEITENRVKKARIFPRTIV